MVKVLHPGLQTSIQDFGRYGYTHLGVPISGVMDRTAASFANALLGNPVIAPVMEITMNGPKLQFFSKTVICISGAKLCPMLNGKPMQNHKPITIAMGDILSFGVLSKGFRAYMAVAGGFKTEKQLSSYSMYKGITQRFVVAKGDTLHVSELLKDAKTQFVNLKNNTVYYDTDLLHVLPGPEFDTLSAEEKEILFDTRFSITADSNRMAYQLHEKLENKLGQLITSVVQPGTVQLTPAGKLIILMRDCQTTGGYPRILQLTERAMDCISQKFAGATVRFALKSNLNVLDII